jgi:hypothetical protein
LWGSNWFSSFLNLREICTQNIAYFRTNLIAEDLSLMNVYLAIILNISLLSFPMAQQYETQQYKTIKTLKKAEIRYYPSVMKIKANRDVGFNVLFGYISGKNHKKQNIAMTTPVYMQKDKGQEVMEFVLPSSFDVEDAPKPISEKIEVYQSKPGYFIAYAFGGYALDWVTQRAIKTVKKIAESNQVSIEGDPILLVYNSPYKVINRKNEILFKIDYKEPQTE